MAVTHLGLSTSEHQNSAIMQLTGGLSAILAIGFHLMVFSTGHTSARCVTCSDHHQHPKPNGLTFPAQPHPDDTDNSISANQASNADHLLPQKEALATSGKPENRSWLAPDVLRERREASGVFVWPVKRMLDAVVPAAGRLPSEWYTAPKAAVQTAWPELDAPELGGGAAPPQGEDSYADRDEWSRQETDQQQEDLTSVLTLTVTEQQPTTCQQPSSRLLDHLCGPVLTSVLSLVCATGVRPAGHQFLDSPERGIVEECCYNRCTLRTLASYCNDECLRTNFYVGVGPSSSTEQPPTSTITVPPHYAVTNQNPGHTGWLSPFRGDFFYGSYKKRHASRAHTPQQWLQILSRAQARGLWQQRHG